MKQKKVWVGMVITLVVLTAATALIMAQEPQESPLEQLLLQADELPAGSWVRHGVEPLTADDWPGSFVNAPTQAEGFLQGYWMEAVCPVRFRDAEGGAIVLNLVFRYQNETQANAEFKRQVEYLKEGPGIEVVRAEWRNADDGLWGFAVQGTGSEGNTVCGFAGVRGNTLTILVVDGPPDPSVEELFGALVERTLQ